MAFSPRLRPALNPAFARYPALHVQRVPFRRSLYLAPPYLLDDYIPRYQLLSSVDAAKKRSLAYAHLRECNLCPRLCGVNRYETTGVCMIGAETVKVNTIAPHFGGMSDPSTPRIACADTDQKSLVSRDTMAVVLSSSQGAT
jgi:putative pyruvate formate lyase activating enzyme